MIQTDVQHFQQNLNLTLFAQIAIVVLAIAALSAAAPAPKPQLLAAYTAPELLGAAPGAYAPYATAVASREFHGASPFYGYAAAPYVSAPYVAAAPAAAYSAAYPYYF